MFLLNRNCTASSAEQWGGRKYGLYNKEQEQHMFCIQPFASLTAALNGPAGSHIQEEELAECQGLQK